MKTKFTCVIITAILFAIAVNAQNSWQIAGNSNISSNNFIGTKTKMALKLRTNNIVRMTISSSGNIGIGTTSPKSKLDVTGTITGFDSYLGKVYPISAGTSGASYSSVGYGLTFTDTTANYRYRLNDFSSMLSFRAGGFDFNTAPFGTAGTSIPYTTVMNISQNGNVGIGDISPGYKFYVTASTGGIQESSVAYIKNTGGTTKADGLYINAGSNTDPGVWYVIFYRPDGKPIAGIQQNSLNSVNYYTTSDKRLKNIIGTSQKGLSDLMKIKIYDYTFKSDLQKQVQTGFMAQELYDIFPQAVSKPRDNSEPAEKNPWMVDYGGVTPLIIKSVQEQQQMIDELKKSNDGLKKQNESLQNQIDELKAMIVSNQSMATSQQSTVITSASLQQNIPNPFNHTTNINYTLPQTYSSAKIIVVDKTGKVLKEVNVSAKGKGSLNVDASTLLSGAYSYSLYVDGKLIDSKQMVLAK